MPRLIRWRNRWHKRCSPASLVLKKPKMASSSSRSRHLARTLSRRRQRSCPCSSCSATTARCVHALSARSALIGINLEINRETAFSVRKRPGASFHFDKSAGDQNQGTERVHEKALHSVVCCRAGSSREGRRSLINGSQSGRYNPEAAAGPRAAHRSVPGRSAQLEAQQGERRSTMSAMLF